MQLPFAMKEGICNCELLSSHVLCYNSPIFVFCTCTYLLRSNYTLVNCKASIYKEDATNREMPFVGLRPSNRLTKLSHILALPLKLEYIDQIAQLGAQGSIRFWCETSINI